MRLPACRHQKRSAPVPPQGLAWLAAEPFRVFFLTGVLWSILGVSLWPRFYAGQLSYYPGLTHARIMIECFGGAFVVGFLGTAGPRMASAPRLSAGELVLLLGLHLAAGVSHLTLHNAAGDWCFLGLLTTLLLALVVRVIRFRKEAPPPQMLLALTGLCCGIAGALMLRMPEWSATAASWRVAGLLLYQGFLLPPVLGIGSFLFPRILGGEFGEGDAPGPRLVRAGGAAVLLITSFFVEVAVSPLAGYLLRAGTAVAYLLTEVRWRKREDDPPRGTLSGGMHWALLTGLSGLLAAGFAYERHVALEHLLYIGGFGLLMLVVASRVLFGHSGDLAGFSKRGWIPRILILLVFLAATTRASADFLPRILISHYKYAAWSWAIAAVLWLVWHRCRFLRRDPEQSDPAEEPQRGSLR